MIRAANDIGKAKPKKKKRVEEPHADKSSDSEPEPENSKSEEQLFKEVINDYCTSSEVDKMPKFQKTLLKDSSELQIDLNTVKMLQHSKLYRYTAAEYKKKFPIGMYVDITVLKNYAANRARWIFCTCSEKIFRTANSTGEIERHFSDSCRCIDGRRGGRLRKDLIQL